MVESFGGSVKVQELAGALKCRPGLVIYIAVFYIAGMITASMT
jgi:hypothetical protein